MNVGLLVADHILPEFEHIDGQYIDMYSNLLPELELTPYYVCDNEFPNSVSSHEFYICTGSKRSVYEDEEWIRNLKSFVSGIGSTNSKFIGVCFGHQILAEAMGGSVDKATNGWSIGVHNMKIEAKETWMNPDIQSVNILMLCQDQVHSLPLNSQVIASTKTCPVGLFTVNDNMLGIQGHPEFSREYNQTLFSARKEIIGEEKVTDALKHINRDIHNDIIAKWIINFLKA